MSDLLHLTLLHTNDLHGRVRQLCSIVTLIRSIRAEVKAAGGYSLYLDAGDSEDTTLIESALTRGSTMNALLRSAGCNQVALGNAIPIRYGPQGIENLAVHLDKPILCANLMENSGKAIPGLAPFAIEEINGFKIGIIGMTAPMSIYPEVYHYRVDKPIDCIADWVNRVHEAGAQFVIALTHIGSKHDFELAEQIPGIDIIVGGHDHRQMTPPPGLQRTLIVQTGDHGRFLGRLDLSIDRSNGKVVNYRVELIPVTPDIPEDPEMLLAEAREKEIAQKLMQVEIGETLVPIPWYEYRESPAGNLLVDAIFERVTGAQVGFMLNGHWQNGLEAGVISLGELNSALRSTGNPARVELSGTQIRQFLMNALKPENIANKPHAFRGNSVGLPHVAGMQVIVEPSTPDAIEVLVNGSPIVDDNRYVVATSDFEISDILNYLYIPDDLVEYEVPTILADAVEDYIRKNSPITDIPGQRIMYRT